MPQVDISVVIPCYNVAGLVHEAVESVFAQHDAGAIQVICVDNNSTDSTAVELKKIADECPVRIESEIRRGACAARNKGLACAQGKYIQFLDADDLLKPGKLKTQLAFSAEHGDTNVAGAYERLNLKGESKLFVPDEDGWKGLFNTKFGITSSLLLVKSDVERVGGWNEELPSSQEYDLMFRMMKTGARFVSHKEPLTIVRERESGQISQSSSAPRWQRYLQLRVEVMQFLASSQPDYYETNESFFRQSFFDLVRTVYLYEPKVAKDFYARNFPLGYKPSKSSVTGNAYLFLHSLFGFPGADKIKNMFARA